MACHPEAETIERASYADTPTHKTTCTHKRTPTGAPPRTQTEAGDQERAARGGDHCADGPALGCAVLRGRPERVRAAHPPEPGLCPGAMRCCVMSFLARTLFSCSLHIIRHVPRIPVHCAVCVHTHGRRSSRSGQSEPPLSAMLSGSPRARAFACCLS